MQATRNRPRQALYLERKRPMLGRRCRPSASSTCRGGGGGWGWCACVRACARARASFCVCEGWGGGWGQRSAAAMRAWHGSAAKRPRSHLLAGHLRALAGDRGPVGVGRSAGLQLALQRCHQCLAKWLYLWRREQGRGQRLHRPKHCYQTWHPTCRPRLPPQTIPPPRAPPCRPRRPPDSQTSRAQTWRWPPPPRAFPAPAARRPPQAGPAPPCCARVCVLLLLLVFKGGSKGRMARTRVQRRTASSATGHKQGRRHARAGGRRAARAPHRSA